MRFGAPPFHRSKSLRTHVCVLSIIAVVHYKLRELSSAAQEHVCDIKQTIIADLRHGSRPWRSRRWQTGSSRQRHWVRSADTRSCPHSKISTPFRRLADFLGQPTVVDNRLEEFCRHCVQRFNHSKRRWCNNTKQTDTVRTFRFLRNKLMKYTNSVSSVWKEIFEWNEQ